MVAETTRTRKPSAPIIPYVPQVETIDFTEQTFAVQSQSEPTRFYLVDLLNTTCECKAGETGFVNCKTLGVCKHIQAARIVLGALTDLLMQVRAREAGQAARQPQPTPPAFIPAPDYLQEMYG